VFAEQVLKPLQHLFATNSVYFKVIISVVMWCQRWTSCVCIYTN